jgi:hypothetical protein
MNAIVEVGYRRVRRLDVHPGPVATRVGTERGRVWALGEWWACSSACCERATRAV